MRSMKFRRIALFVAGFATLASCDLKRPTGVIVTPFETVFKTVDANGLEQTVTVQPPPTVEDATPIMGITSVIKNTNIKGVRVITRHCMLLPEDVNTSFGQMLPAGEPPECEQFVDTLDLLPGQSTPQVSADFLADVPTGVYSMTVRQSITPSFYTEARFQRKIGK